MTQPTMADLLIEDDDDLLIEDEAVGAGLTVQDSGNEPRAENQEPTAQSLELGLMQVLPADFELPKLIRFVPDPRLKAAADEATRYALAVEVAGPEGLQRADVGLTALRTSLKAIQDHFQEPADLANDVHKRITGRRAEWLADGTAAAKTVGSRIATEQQRLQRIADDDRRKAQEEENRKTREQLRRQAEEAAKQKAPAPVVEQMRKAAETATAPPVARAASEPPKLAGQTVVKTWKARVVGTPADAEANPTIDQLTPPQLAEVMTLLRGILEGRDPISAIEINWSVLNSRAKSDKSTLRISGIEAFEDLGVRSKGSRGR